MVLSSPGRLDLHLTQHTRLHVNSHLWQLPSSAPLCPVTTLIQRAGMLGSSASRRGSDFEWLPESDCDSQISFTCTIPLQSISLISHAIESPRKSLSLEGALGSWLATPENKMWSGKTVSADRSIASETGGSLDPGKPDLPDLGVHPQHAGHGLKTMQRCLSHRAADQNAKSWMVWVDARSSWSRPPLSGMGKK